MWLPFQSWCWNLLKRFLAHKHRAVDPLDGVILEVRWGVVHLSLGFPLTIFDLLLGHVALCLDCVTQSSGCSTHRLAATVATKVGQSDWGICAVCTRSIWGITRGIAFAKDDACACDVRGKQVLERGKYRSFQSDFKCLFTCIYINSHFVHFV